MLLAKYVRAALHMHQSVFAFALMLSFVSPMPVHCGPRTLNLITLSRPTIFTMLLSGAQEL